MVCIANSYCFLYISWHKNHKKYYEYCILYIRKENNWYKWVQNIDNLSILIAHLSYSEPNIMIYNPVYHRYGQLLYQNNIYCQNYVHFLRISIFLQHLIVCYPEIGHGKWFVQLLFIISWLKNHKKYYEYCTNIYNCPGMLNICRANNWYMTIYPY